MFASHLYGEVASVLNSNKITDKQILGFPKLLSLHLLSMQVEDIISPVSLLSLPTSCIPWMG